jgi:hypothetical protein
MWCWRRIEKINWSEKVFSIIHRYSILYKWASSVRCHDAKMNKIAPDATLP